MSHICSPFPNLVSSCPSPFKFTEEPFFFFKDEKSTRLVYTGLIRELEHLKIKTRLINERFVSVMGECVI